VVLISHRLSTTRNADRIVLIGDGAVLEQGDHDSLMRADGTYARLFSLQAARFVESGGTR
jgi:ABC-type multidrug transport system fused ATPase/permease subunit